MIQSYYHFSEDVKEAFKEYLSHHRYTLKKEVWFQDQFCYKVVLENEYNLLIIEVDELKLIISIGFKKDQKVYRIDDLLSFFYPKLHIDSEKDIYNIHTYYDLAKQKGANSKELSEILVKHNLLGELMAYQTIIKKHLSHIAFDGDYSWCNDYNQSGRKIFDFVTDP
ncbi:hypothetical protein [Aquimarina mytili]|uniref:Uncharacterized protein n=1 Tax=Aquimarina mytili TaxID=874423 RepID=A0A936ZUH4_9FLAO|nr:hypothetical protein [Aquimarina mytili]MBL0685814.1 hypothetical protein [Aquimarina mytili]